MLMDVRLIVSKANVLRDVDRDGDENGDSALAFGIDRAETRNRQAVGQTAIRKLLPLTFAPVFNHHFLVPFITCRPVPFSWFAVLRALDVQIERVTRPSSAAGDTERPGRSDRAIRHLQLASRMATQTADAAPAGPDGSDPMADPEERRVLSAALDSFR